MRFDRWTVYASILGVLGYLPVFAWLQLQVAEYRVYEVRANCEFNYYELYEAWAFPGMSHCLEYIDEYRFIETSGAGFNPLLAELCRVMAADPDRERDLVCTNLHFPPRIPAVPYFSYRHDHARFAQR